MKPRVLPVEVHEPRAPDAKGNTQPEATTQVASQAASTRPQDAYVGRDGALELLEASVHDGLQGRGRLLLLIGEPGIGKTRTLREIARRALETGAQTWFGRCIEDEGAPAFWPWTQILRDAEKDRGSRRLIATMGKSAADIAQGIPELREWLPDQPASPSIDQASARFRFFDALTLFLRRAAQEHPVVLLFDDLQRADQPSLRLLSFVARHLDRSNLVIVGSLRPIASQAPGMREALTSFVEQAPVSSIELQGLSPEDVARYVELCIGQRAPQSAVDRMHRLTGGNPLFLQQILHGLQTRRALDVQINWEDFLLSSQALGLQSSIARQLSGLDDSCRSMLRVAAVLGTEFNLARVALLLDVDPASLLPFIDGAKTHGLVRETPSAMRSYRFAHVLIRDALYEDLSGDRRAQLHAGAGTMLEAEGAVTTASLSEIAHHFVQAWPSHDAGKALHYTLRAASAAKARLAYEEAAAHLDLALQILAHAAVDPERRMRLLLDKGEILTHAAQTSSARAALIEAVALARQLRANNVIARAASLIGDLPESGKLDGEQVALLREALALVSQTDPQRPYLSALLAKCSTYSTQFEARETLAFNAIAQSKRVTDPILRAETLHQCHVALTEPKHLPTREAIAKDLDRLSHLHGDRRILWHAANAQVQNCLERGDFAGVDSAIATIENLAAQAREPIFRWYMTVFRAMRLYVAGQMNEGLQASDEALRIGTCLGEDAARHAHAMQVTGWLRVMGRSAESEIIVRDMTLRFPALPGWRAVLGSMEGGRGRVDNARRALEHVIATLGSLNDPYTLSTLSALAELGGYFGTPEMARTIYEALLPYSGIWGNVGSGVSTYGPMGRQIGMVAIRAGNLDAADAHLEASLRGSEAARSPTFITLTCQVYARSLLKRGTPHATRMAAEVLQRAESINRRFGFAGCSFMVQFLAKQAGIVLPGA